MAMAYGKEPTTQIYRGRSTGLKARAKKGSEIKSDPKVNTIALLERMSCLPSTFSKLKPYSQAESLIRRSRWAWAAQPSYKPLYPVRRERAHRCT
jgi:hypothetical protein